ncbi:MAG: hypothetical protein AB7O24_05720 [Kofleriaceae bacterium]
MTEDDRAVMARLAALEAEVKADAEAQQARKDAAMAKVREQRASQLAERDELRARQAALVSRRPTARAEPGATSVDGDSDELGSAIALAKRAHGVKQELSRTPKTGEKSWAKSGLASMLLGPLGWLYAGSLREAIPASVAWVAFAAAASFLPTMLLMPVLLVTLPLSGIAGVTYALRYNRAGARQRLFDRDKTRQLPGK